MSAQPEKPETVGFIKNQNYKFDPAIETNCVSVMIDSPWMRKNFVNGWCLGYQKEKGGFIFQGKPVGEEVEHFFIVQWGKGSVAEAIPRPMFRVVK